MRNSHKKGASKGISWRIVATLTTVGLVYIFTGSFMLSLGVCAAEIIARFAFYYIYERTWEKFGIRDWRVVASLTTMGLVYIFTENLTLSLKLGAVEIIAKSVFYHLHEQIWRKLHWE